MRYLIILLAVLFFMVPRGAFAHGGGLDSNGGHHDRKRGGYHYHNRVKTSPKTYYKPKVHRYSAPEITVKSVAKPIPKVHAVRVVGFSDGDTITVLLNGKEVKVRLYGIDCPEKSQAFGKAAKKAIQQILSGRDVKIKIIDYDKYGRAVAMVYADGKSANDIMVQAGYAWVYTKYCKESFCDKWKLNEGTARRSKRGLWQLKSPEAPWEWRSN